MIGHGVQVIIQQQGIHGTSPYDGDGSGTRHGSKPHLPTNTTLLKQPDCQTTDGLILSFDYFVLKIGSPLVATEQILGTIVSENEAVGSFYPDIPVQ